MEINLSEIEGFALYLHLKEWLDECQFYQKSDNFELRGQWSALKNICRKLESKI